MSGTAQFVAAKGQIQAFDTGSSLLMSDYFTASGSFSNPFPSENSLWFPTVFSIISYPMSLF